VFGVDELCQWAEVGAQCVECVSEVVTEGFLAVSAAEEVASIGVKRVCCSGCMAWVGGVWEAEFALQ
jgi:hypothetical protein